MKINDTFMTPRVSAPRVEKKVRTASANASEPARRFDTVMISNVRRADENTAATRLREAVSLDVRSAAASQADRIPAIREEIRSGSYQVDPYAIARKILTQGEIA